MKITIIIHNSAGISDSQHADYPSAIEHLQDFYDRQLKRKARRKPIRRALRGRHHTRGDRPVSGRTWDVAIKMNRQFDAQRNGVAEASELAAQRLIFEASDRILNSCG